METEVNEEEEGEEEESVMVLSDSILANKVFLLAENAEGENAALRINASVDSFSFRGGALTGIARRKGQSNFG